ncbi:MAG: gas vesicle protein GvpD P-loop domain-containing protein [Candidatus Baldrarchaeia archaeon]
MVKAVSGCPEEILKPLDEGGFSLLIKGQAGTGKTTLTLEILRDMSKFGSVLYISTRLSPKFLYEKFPWVKEELPEGCIMDARVTRIPQETPSNLVFKYINEMDLVRNLHNKVEEVGEGLVTIAIDSLDALKMNLGLSEQNFDLENTLVSMASREKVNFVLVSEKSGNTMLDYIVDGIVTLTREIMDDCLIRKLYFEKIRGMEIERPVLLYTLRDARFTYFKSEVVPYPSEFTSPPLITSEGKISTGIQSFDELFGGGLRPEGSVHLLEVGSEVGLYYFWLIYPLVISLLRQGIPVIYVPSAGEAVKNTKVWITSFVNKGLYEQLMKFEEISGGMGGEFSVPKKSLEDAVAVIRKIMDSIDDIKDLTGSPIVALIISADIIEYVYGVDLASQILNYLTIYSKRENVMEFVIVKYGQPEIITRLSHMVSTHFVMENINGIIFLRGKIPKTGMYAITVDTSKGYIDTNLIPIQ